MKSLVLISLLLAQAPDAPFVLGESKLHDVRVVQKGDPAPDKGLWMDESAALQNATELQNLRYENETRPTYQTVAIAFVVGLVAGAAAGVGFTLALSRR